MKLSERLEALLALAECTDDAERDHNAPDSMCVFVDVRPSVFDALLREAAELARRVEDAPCAVAGQSPGRFYYVGGSAPVEHGQRVRLVPDSPTPPDPTPQEVPDGGR